MFSPLDRRVAFCGVFEDPLKQIVSLRPRQVALLNARVVRNAERQLYCAKTSFVVLHKGEIREVEFGRGNAK